MPGIWLVAGLVLLVWAWSSALLPLPPACPVTLNDKLLHAAGFLFFMLWFGGVFEARFAAVASSWRLSAYGLLIELLQSLTPTRQAEVLDLVADVAGVLLGWAPERCGTLPLVCETGVMVRTPESLSNGPLGGESPAAGWRPLADRMRPATLARGGGAGASAGRRASP